MNELQTLNQRIAEKVGKELIDLIPPDQWQKIVDDQIFIFKRDIAPKVIQEELKKLLEGKVKEVLSAPEFNYEYNQFGQRLAGEAVDVLIKRSAPELVSALFGGAIQHAVDQLKYGLR